MILPQGLTVLKLDPTAVEIGEKELGEGSFGIVVDAQHRDFGRVAIKQPRNLGGMTPAERDSMLREVNTMHGLRHPNLLRLLGVCVDAKATDARGALLGICLCLEYCDMGSLYSVITSTLSADEAKCHIAASNQLRTSAFELGIELVSAQVIAESDFNWERRVRIAAGTLDTKVFAD